MGEAFEFLPLRPAPVAEAAVRVYDAWLAGIEARLADPACDRDELCRELLTGIYYPQLAGTDPATLPETARVALLQMDPRNVTLEPEYYAETDPERFARVKPLLWLWEMFDKSPLGENVHVGVKLRRILARHVFRRCGRNFKCFQFVKLSFGYNLEVGDDVVVHRHVLLDDRGGIVIGDRVSISDYANVYSHSHALDDGRDVRTPTTVIGSDVRITYHATVLAGARLGDSSMLGALSLATKPVAPGKVALGIPAHPKMHRPPRSEWPDHPRSRDPLADE